MGDENFWNCDRHSVEIVTPIKGATEYEQMQKFIFECLDKFQGGGIKTTKIVLITIAKLINVL